MSSGLNGVLLGIEKRLGSLGLPAGPDHLINHKALLGIFFGAIGAFIGWIITEPHTEEFSFFRDFLILTVVGFTICFFIMLTETIFERTLSSFLKALIFSVVAAIFVIAPSVLITKYLFTPEREFPKWKHETQKPYKVFVLDVSGSMEGLAIDTLKKAVHAYLGITEKNDPRKLTQVACVVFSNESRVISEFSNDYSDFLSRVDAIKAGGGTNMAAGLTSAREIVERVISAEKSGPVSTLALNRETLKPTYELILVSDGEPNVPQNVNKATEAVMQTLAFFSSNRCPINTVGAGKDYKRPLLQEISSKTGGQFVAADDIKNLVPVFEKLAYRGLTQAGPDRDQKLGFTARVSGWIFIGLAIGVCAALPRKSTKAIMLGAIGGFAGGLIGAVAFEGILYFLTLVGGGSGAISRCLGFMLLGASIGFAVPIVESVGKTSWIRIIEGDQTGRIAVLDRTLMTLGSGRNADIRVSGDPGIEPKHIRFTRAGEDQDIESIGKEDFYVNGKKARKARITHEDTVLVGSTQFVYLNKLTGFGIQKGGFEKLDLSNLR